MSAGEEFRELVGRAESGDEDEVPTTEELRKLRHELMKERQRASGELKRLRDGRRGVLVRGTAEELRERDEAIREAERQADQAEARADELGRLMKAAEEREALAGAPELVERLKNALQRTRELRADYKASLGELASAASAVETLYKRHGASHHRQLPKVPAELIEGVNWILGQEGSARFDMPRGRKTPGLPEVSYIKEAENEQQPA